ncbi:MAG: OFA family MFS transporter [Firmicutes bacterium]|nr:OFA family MFS transporter [Bacillota bacterium]
MEMADRKPKTAALNRNHVLIAMAAVALCLGSSYSFGVFVKPLADCYGWSISQTTLAFTLNGLLSPLPMIIGGRVVDQGHSRRVVICGGLLFALCFMFSGSVSKPWMLYVLYSGLGCFGLRAAYSGLIGNGLKLFYDRKGFASGIIAASYASAAVFIAPAANYLIERYGVAAAFRVLGLIYLAVVLAAALFIKEAPQPGPPRRLDALPGGKGVNLNWRQMIKTRRFYWLVAVFVCGSMAGLMLIAEASVLGQGFFGLTAAAAAVFVSAYSLANCCGRFVFGPLSDRLGRYPTMIVIGAVVSAVLLLAALFPTRLTFFLSLIGVGLGFGGVMSIMPALVAEDFGQLHYGINYGICYIGYSLGSLLGPQIAAYFGEGRGSVSVLYGIALAFSLCGLLLTWRRWRKS